LLNDFEAIRLQFGPKKQDSRTKMRKNKKEEIANPKRKLNLKKKKKNKKKKKSFKDLLNIHLFNKVT